MENIVPSHKTWIGPCRISMLEKKPLNIFVKSSIIDTRQDRKYVSINNGYNDLTKIMEIYPSRQLHVQS